MATTITMVDAAKNAACNAIVDLLDAGSGDGYVEIRTTGWATLLATLTFADPAFGAASSGVATAGTIDPDTSADDTGTAAEFRAYDSDATEVWRGSVGTSGEGINFNTVSFVAGANVSISSWTVTVS